MANVSLVDGHIDEPNEEGDILYPNSMTDNENINLIYIPKEGNYIEILGHRIDGFESFEDFCEHLKKYAELEVMVNRQKAEIERLKNCVKSEDEVREIAKRTMEPLVKEITREQIDIAVKLAKAEAVKEFAERVKMAFYYHFDELIPSIMADKIDELKKEMVGEDNSSLANKNNKTKEKFKMENKKVIIRADRAGVFFGTLKEKNGTEVTITDCRRLWYWDGAASISQLATNGTTVPTKCKFTVTVPEITILGVIEIIPCTDKAIKSIEGVAEWKR